MKTYETISSNNVKSQNERYKVIDEHESFLTAEGSQLQVLHSVHSVGASREIADTMLTGGYQPDTVKEAARFARVILTGNVSPLGTKPDNYGPSELSPDERVEDAKNNLYRFFALNDVEPSNVRMLLPERDYTTPLGIVNLDVEPLTLDSTGLLKPDVAADMMYTYNPEIIMAARPADCPVVFLTGETPKGEVTSLIHLATLGVTHDYIEQAKQGLDSLGVDKDSLRVQITAGGHGETYRYDGDKEGDPRIRFPKSKAMYVDFEETEDESGVIVAWSYGIDVAAEVYERIIKEWNIDPYQVFLDTSDTTSPTSGYSSHSRSRKNGKNYKVGGDNTRDIVLARRPAVPETKS